MRKFNNKPVLFLDSGIGGIPYCRDFLDRNGNEEVCYIADREHFPYGLCSKEELIAILSALTEKLITAADPKIIVIACNTATICALEHLRRSFNHVPFVGTVPAVKPAVMTSHSGKVGILGSQRTINDTYSHKLAESLGFHGDILGVPATELIEFVEQRFDSASGREKTDIVRKYINIFHEHGVDTIVLACTHFLYLQEEFRKEASPQITILDSIAGITKRIEYLLDENDSLLRSETNFKPAHRLLLTGESPPDSFWQKRAQALGFKLDLLKDT
ncbi:MAG: glutamate racemase [Treponema sp.]|jgi:glutamate racemase|nr:glutamate racemase [Treponema sp.]